MCQSLKASSWRKTEDCDRPSSDILLNHKPSNFFILGTNQGHIMRKPQEQYYNICYLSKLLKTLGLLLGVRKHRIDHNRTPPHKVTYCFIVFLVVLSFCSLLLYTKWEPTFGLLIVFVPFRSWLFSG